MSDTGGLTLAPPAAETAPQRRGFWDKLKLRAPGSRYVSVVRIPCSTSIRSRSARRLRGQPRTCSKSLKRDEPYQTSRRIKRVYFSPTISRARAIEQFEVSRSRRGSRSACVRASVPASME